MKRILSLILTFVLLLSFTACSGNFAQVDLKEPIALSDDGIVEKNVFEKIKNENAIATFTGESGEMKYEWTIFGSDLKDTRDVTLSQKDFPCCPSSLRGSPERGLLLRNRL